MSVPGTPEIRIQRPLYENDQLRQDLNYEKDQTNFVNKLCKEKVSPKSIIKSTIPVLGWLPKYEWRTDILSDLASGYTVAIMHIPQGMAYALLGNVPPVVGIYMAIFPVLVYFFLGTSRHVSMGTFSIACLMTGKAVLEHADPSYFDTTNTNSTDVVIRGMGYSPVQVATTVTFIVSIIQLLMFALRLGAATNLLSDMLVSAFTCGSAFQIVVTQIKDLLGITMPKIKGNFLTIKILKVIFEEIGQTNYAAVIISAITIVVLIFNNEFLKQLVAKKSSIPIPIELIVVIIGTVSSQYLDFHKNYGIKIVGDIPTGFPQPEMPPLDLVPSVLVDGVSTAIVSYAISMSLAMILAQKANYEVDANQELLAMGVSNAVGSFFSCMPLCASLSRSMIQQVVGGKTQIVSIVSSMLLIVTVLWIAPFFESLPKAVLAGIIVVSLKGMLVQVTQLVSYYKLSKFDALVWITTFVSVVFISMEIALMVGISLSLLSIFIASFKPYTCLLGSVPHTDLYLDMNRYKGAKEIEGLKIFHYCGGINFATKGIFKTELYRLINLNPQKELISREKLDKIMNKDLPPTEFKEKVKKLESKINRDLKCIILDFSSVSCLDPCSVTMLRNEMAEFKKLDITFYVAACSDDIYNLLNKCGLLSKEKESLRVFPSIHDAVQAASHAMNIPIELQILPIVLPNIMIENEES
ncbi:sulfate transporter [Diabrotica virgifera virgifera]|uniref:STAS domain-containing protein n=1 Tax=Diabrotica virgifera virgifera TaxID=50390 RepID=A0ABM5JQU2_DIAVI|nr:sulfate transporter [Diabrotica virgifera virgifera]XP_050500308.1 sulfate transporter [Diabrotica virgifera virgifera]XP_050500309.1 sulfate transporter [Diabrotica virgifera virgifera]XP_050500310.1 sulfate transporter [Diabrotica virgifera virgifera]XP_050500311.1 sulfate transporter [Diabrotica virgifera virgifera]